MRATMKRVFPLFPASGGNRRAKIVCCGFEATEHIHAVVRQKSAELIVLSDVAHLAGWLDKFDWGCIIAGASTTGEQSTLTLAQICAERPGMSWIVWSSNVDVSAAVGAMRRGAIDVIRSEDTARLITSLEDMILQGDKRLHSWQEMANVRRRRDELSASEREVLALVMQGKTNREIANQLDFSLRTVESRRQRILRVMQAENAVTLAATLARHGLLEDVVDAGHDSVLTESRSASA